MLTVSMPTFNTPRRLLDRAVRSVLTQDVDLRLVVVNDGGSEPSLHDHPRLDVRNITENRGRYFCDATVLASCDTRWFAVHDADDWSEPGRYRPLIGAAAGGVAFAPYYSHRAGRARTRASRTFDGGFEHLTHWAAAVFDVDRLQRAGGIHPGFRVGYDTLLLLMVSLTGPVAYVPTPTYHYCRRNAGTLTSDPRSDGRSDLRARTRTQLRHLWAQASSADDPGQFIRDDIGRLADQVDQMAATWT